MNIDLGRLMATKEEPGDYVGSDGLLYCGKCHTPKQMRLSFDPATGGKKQTLVHTACKCQKEAAEAERKRLNVSGFSKIWLGAGRTESHVRMVCVTHSRRMTEPSLGYPMPAGGMWSAGRK